MIYVGNVGIFNENPELSGERILEIRQKLEFQLFICISAIYNSIESL